MDFTDSFNLERSPCPCLCPDFGVQHCMNPLLINVTQNNLKVCRCDYSCESSGSNPSRVQVFGIPKMACQSHNQEGYNLLGRRDSNRISQMIGGWIPDPPSLALIMIIFLKTSLSRRLHRKCYASINCIDHNAIALFDIALEDLQCEAVLQFALDNALERSCSKDRVVPFLS